MDAEGDKEEDADADADDLARVGALAFATVASLLPFSNT